MVLVSFFDITQFYLCLGFLFEFLGLIVSVVVEYQCGWCAFTYTELWCVCMLVCCVGEVHFCDKLVWFFPANFQQTSGKYLYWMIILASYTKMGFWNLAQIGWCLKRDGCLLVKCMLQIGLCWKKDCFVADRWCILSGIKPFSSY